MSPATSRLGLLRRARRATRTLTIVALLAPTAACESGGTTEPVATPVAPPPVANSAGTITGTITLAAGVAGSLSNARVAIYTSVNDRAFDRVVRQTALGAGGPAYTFTITDVAPGTYYLDVCFRVGGALSCAFPQPDSPISVIAGRVSTVSFEVGG